MANKAVKPAAKQQYFSKGEVAKITGVSERTVTRWIQGGHLPTRKIGKRDKVFIDDLDEAIKSGKLAEDDK